MSPLIFHVYKNEIDALDENDPNFNAQLNAIFNRSDDATITLVETALKMPKQKLFMVLKSMKAKTILLECTYHANLAWSGDSVYSMDSAEEARNPKILNYALPVEGSNVWFDGWCIKGANKELAQDFVNFISDPAMAVSMYGRCGYTSPIG